jgi:hypothetical protein
MAEWVLPVILSVIAASGGWLTWLTNRRSSDKRDLRELTRRVDQLERRDMVWRNYAQLLRDHIYQAKPPPPPPWPVDALYERQDERQDDDR